MFCEPEFVEAVNDGGTKWKCRYCGFQAVDRIGNFPDRISRFCPQLGDRCFAGTELKKLLATFGMKSIRGCGCVAKAKLMDRRGCDWCEENVDEILGWLRSASAERRLPFVDFIGRQLIATAIAAARDSVARRQSQSA